jgi:hypothetical protein
VTRDRARKKAIRARMAAGSEPYSVAARKLTNPSTPSVPVSVGEIIARTDATLAAPSTRIEFRVDLDLARPESGPAPRRPGPGGPIGRLVARSARAAWARFAGEDAASLREAFAHPVAAGFIEPAAARYLLDYGHYATMSVDGKRVGGRSGTLVQGRHPDRQAPEPYGDPLVLLRLPRSATGARSAGDETLRGTPCRMIAVTTPDPAGLTVWIDDEHIRQVRYTELMEHVSRIATLELWDFGVPVDSLDWSRLPGFRTPG